MSLICLLSRINAILMMNAFIIYIPILPPQVEIYKVFEPYFGIIFVNIKVRIIDRFASIRVIRDLRVQ